MTPPDCSSSRPAVMVGAAPPSPSLQAFRRWYATTSRAALKAGGRRLSASVASSRYAFKLAGSVLKSAPGGGARQASTAVP